MVPLPPLSIVYFPRATNNQLLFLFTISTTPAMYDPNSFLSQLKSKQNRTKLIHFLALFFRLFFGLQFLPPFFQFAFYQAAYEFS